MNPIDPTAVIAQAQPMTLSELAGRINAEHERAEAAARAGLKHARAAGQLLAQAKRQVGHGRWLAWIREHCKTSARTVQAYMRVAERWDELAGKCAEPAHLTLERGLQLLTADAPAVDGLTSEGQRAVDGGLIDAEAGRLLLPLAVYDRLATLPCPVKESWADLQAKKILWRPTFARSAAQIAAEVDSCLADLSCMEMDFDQLPPAEAEEKAKAALKAGPDMNEQGMAPAYYWASLWLGMRPDYTRLTGDDRSMVSAATDRYLHLTV